MSKSRSGGTLASSAMEDGHHEPEQVNNHSGHGEGESTSGRGGGDEDEMVDSEKVIERFLSVRKEGLADSSKYEYANTWKRFAEHAKAGNWTVKQLEGRIGRDLIIDWIATIPLYSRRSMLANLKSVWVYGLKTGLTPPTWPIDARRDLKRFPQTRRGRTPDDAVVGQWYEAIKHEPCILGKAYWLWIVCTGHRPHMAWSATWENIEYREGRPHAIMMYGGEMGHKTDARIACYIPPVLGDALVALRDAIPFREKGDLVFPKYIMKGGVGYERTHMTEKNHRILWERIRRTWKLPSLTARDLRHWVDSTCRDTDLSDEARQLMMGHMPDRRDMGQVYDHRTEAVRIKEQAQYLEFGTVGRMFDAPMVEVVDQVPRELVTVWNDLRSGKIGIMAAMVKMEELLMKSRTSPRTI